MRILVAFLYLYLCSMSVLAFDNKIRVVTEDLPPFQIDNGELPPKGVLVDLVKLILQEADIETPIELFPWARSYSLALNEPNTLIFSMLRSKEREEKFKWIAHLYTIKSYFAALKSRTDIKINKLNDAKQYSIGSVRDDLAESYLIDKGFIHDKNLYVTSKYPTLWQMLFNGRVDLAFTNSIVWQYEVNIIGLDTNKLTMVYQIPDFDTDLYLAASKNTDDAIVNKLKAAFIRIVENGRYQKTLDRWHLTAP
ncbi:substrate-binding periplasmic protein [Thalassotalea profundi]|uniref:Solute-binding protein family 3/N-terminal domain-containing protein n=1 Tax=Thalassotalea profundi TaxID=2036687 RepID=A0ABQ3J0F6_9GAMM|nr:ABC transporter substrate-binding protein [Thalassotalea profundi]GHF00323.1 hypothetical protein GCM10011501_32320 [Thalassotalea profundi]